MPEGPEVTLMTDELRDHFAQSVLSKVIIHKGRYAKKPPAHWELFQKSLPLTIEKINNKSKYIYLLFSKGWAMGIQPIMSGHFWLPGVSKPFKTTEGYRYDPKHNHWQFETSKGTFFFNDPRRWGILTLFPPEEKENTLKKKLATLGPDVIKELPEMSFEAFDRILRRCSKKKVLADFLLEQKYLSGIGNYLRAEICYHADVSPFLRVSSLTQAQRRQLKTSIAYWANKSYQTQKKKGFHQIEYNVYGKKEATATKWKKRIVWWVPKKVIKKSNE